MSAQVAADTGLLVRLDQAVHDLVVAGGWRQHAVIPVALDHIGQREPIAGLLFGIATTLSLYRCTPRPLVVSLLPLIAVNLVVGATKIGIGRGKPSTDDTTPFVDGMAYPSGHTANVVLTWGLMAYLLFVYGQVRWRKSDSLAVVAGLSLLMGVVSVYRDTHWLTDIVAGWLIGAVLLQATIVADIIVTRRPLRPFAKPAGWPGATIRPRRGPGSAPERVSTTPVSARLIRCSSSETNCCGVQK